MKSNIYYIEFYDGEIRINKNKSNILDDIFEYLKYTEYNFIGENQLDAILYNRIKTLPKFIKKIGVCSMDKLMDNIVLDMNKPNKVYSEKYRKTLLNKKYNEKLEWLKKNTNEIEFSKFKTISNVDL